MKKTILAAALFAATGVTQAATTNTFAGTFEFWDATQTLASTDTAVTGGFDMVNGTGSFESPTPFNGVNWTAEVHDMFMFDAAQADASGVQAVSWDFTYQLGLKADGTGTANCTITANFDGCTGFLSTVFTSDALSYNFNLTQGQFAAGVIFDWSVNNDIPVLAVMNTDTFDPATGVMTVSSVDTDGDGAPGTQMLVGPFPGQTPSFGGTLTPVSAIPVPAAVWLFGSGLVGLAGVARRRKTA